MLAEPGGIWSARRGRPRGAGAADVSQEGAGEEKPKPSLFLCSHLLPVPLTAEPEVTGAWRGCAGASSYPLVRANRSIFRSFVSQLLSTAIVKNKILGRLGGPVG